VANSLLAEVLSSALRPILPSMTDSPLDAAPADGLELAFELPEYIAQADDGRYLALYEELVLRLRREAQGIPMTTNMWILLERIATKYVILKYREDTHFTWVGSGEKDFGAQLLENQKEFNKVLAQSQEKLLQSVMMEVNKITRGGLELIKDDEDRRNVRRFFQEQYSRIGY